MYGKSMGSLGGHHIAARLHLKKEPKRYRRRRSRTRSQRDIAKAIQEIRDRSPSPLRASLWRVKPPLPPELPVTDAPWPELFQICYVITIREYRWERCKQRLASIYHTLQKWDGTVGLTINRKRWIERGILRNETLRRGQLGCYDSHRRIWKNIIDKQIPYAVVLEDDVDLQPKRHNKIIGEAIQQLQSIDPTWEFLYLSRSVYLLNNKRQFTSHIVRPAESYGCFAYCVSLKGAQKLWDRSYPIREALDLYVSRQITEGIVNGYAIWPNLFFVTTMNSDTATIR